MSDFLATTLATVVVLLLEKLVAYLGRTLLTSGGAT